MVRIATLLGLFVLGCGAGGPARDSLGTGFTGPTITGGNGATDGSDGTGGSLGPGGTDDSSSGSSAGGGSDGTGGPKFDTADGATSTATAGDGDLGCDKIDFLFIIDNSQSMEAHQANLLANFAPFMDTIAQEVQGGDYQIMVLDSDACPTYGGPCDPNACEGTLGAGQVRDCPVPADTRYLDSSMGDAAIQDAFTCAANVGVAGSHSELPMSAMVAAVGPENQANGCNPGFVRDDAILVITFITDDHVGFAGDDDVRNVGSPGEWYDAVVAAKGGNADSVVVLGLVALLSDQSCIIYGPQEADRFVAFVEMFGDNGRIGSVCEPDYDAFFQEAVGLIDTTCDNFPPQG